MKKYRKQIYRITSLLCSIVLIVSLAALPASASSMETDTSITNYFDYNFSETAFDFHDDYTSCSFPLNKKIYIRYIDCLVTGSIPFSSVSVIRGTNTSSLSVLELGNGLYRIYGQVGGGPSAWDDQLTFAFSITDRTQVNFLSLRYSTTVQTRIKDVATLTAGPNRSSSGSTSVTMPNPNTGVNVPLSMASQPGAYWGYISLINWRKYDAMDVLLKCDTGGLSSLLVEIEGLAVPFNATFFDSSNGQVGYIESDWDSVLDETEYYFLNDYTYQWVLIHVDLRNIMRTFSGQMFIEFTGDLTPNFENAVSLNSAIGLIYTENDSVLGNLFFDLKTYLADLFGKDDPGAAQAAQSQEQLNVEINNQVSAAVSDWDVHIVEVQDGYDSGFEGAVPALSWLSSLAEGIFGNMGWFGSIYLLVGLISVYVLFLNKGGLIGRKLK